jgi:hypothetical protein
VGLIVNRVWHRPCVCVTLLCVSLLCVTAVRRRAGSAAAGASLWDESPPLTFLVNAYEHDVTTESACNAAAFFGAGGACSR